MKKLFSFLLVAALVFTLTSCALKLPPEEASGFPESSDSTDSEPIEPKPNPTEPARTEPKKETPTAPVEDVSEFELNSIQQFENINFSVSSKWSKSSNSQGLYYFFEDGCMLYISASDDKPALSDSDVFQACSSGLFGENGGFSDASIQSEKSTTILGNSGKLWRAKHSLNSQPHESLFLVFRYSSKIFSFICTNLDNLSNKDERYFLQIVDTISPSESADPSVQKADFFDDSARQEQYKALFESYQYSKLVEFVNQYIAESDCSPDDSAYSILKLVEPALKYENSWIITHDEFDNTYSISFKGATEISSTNSVAVAVSGTTLLMKTGFRKSGWLFFDKITLSINGERAYSENIKSYHTERNVISGGVIEEYCFANFYDNVLETLKDAEKVILRFENGGSGEKYDHVLSQEEIDSLYCGLLLQTTYRELSNLLYKYNKDHT